MEISTSNKINQTCSIHDIRVIAEETNKIGETVLNAIEKQDEQLDATNSNIKSSEELHKSSEWILRNMTWSGWFYNLFTKTPNIRVREIKQYKTTHTHTSNNSDNQSKISNINTNLDKSPQNTYIRYNSLAFNNEINEIEKTLKNIKTTGIKIGEKLDEQNKKLDETTHMNDNLNEQIKKSNNKIIRWL
jgi:hypothetical protein